MSDEPRIKPCPFCGKQPVCEKRYVDRGGGDGQTCFRILCVNIECNVMPTTNACGPRGYVRTGDDCETDQEADRKVIEFWNTRH